MNIVYAGTPEVAVAPLQKLAQAHQVVAILTRPDARVGRKQLLSSSPVKQTGIELEIPVYHTVDDLLDALGKLPENQQPEVGIVVAYGKILKPQVLNALKYGWYNLHFSLLPKWRGAAPVQHAILNGDYTSGLSIFKLQEGLDDGPILQQQKFLINQDMTSGEVLGNLAELGANLLPQVVADICQIAKNPELLKQQSGQSTLAPKLLKEGARINWNASAMEIVRKINAYSPNPGAWFELHQPDKPNLRIVALKAVLEDDSVKLLKVKPAGKSAMDYTAWLNGLKGDYNFV